MRSPILRTLIPSLLQAVFLTGVAHASDRPNILYIMSDDHAAHGIGCYGGRLAKLNPTPILDKLAAEGIRLKNCFVTNSICTPSRATIMTGQYSHKTGCYGFRVGLPGPRQTLGHEMNKLGYETAVVGKWHLLEEPEPFSYYAVLPGQGSYSNPIFRVRGSQPWPKNTIRKSGYDNVHSSDAITDLSLQWLKNRKEKAKPFFLMHHFKAPHDNFENAERYDWLYEDVEIPEPETLWSRGTHGPKGREQYGTSVGPRNKRRNMGDHMFVDKSLNDRDYTRTAYQRYLKKFLRCVKGVDDNVGRLIAHLKSTGELDNTVIIYTADQGFMLGEHDYIDKRWIYEESLRMPFIVRYPKRFNGGGTSDAIVNNTDFAPTILELAGIDPAEMPAQFQGRSIVPVLGGNTPGDWRTEHYYRYWLHMAHHDNPAHFGIRTATHKLAFFYGLPCGVKGAADQPTQPHWELYDIANDPNETTNLAGESSQVETFEKLKKQLVALRERVGDTDPNHPEVNERLKKAVP